MDLESSYRLCQRITRHQAKNFYYAFITLPRNKRRAIYAVYAFCREADDIADGNLTLEEKKERLENLRRRLYSARAGDPQIETDIALSDAIARFGIDAGDLAHVLDGVEMDLVISRYESFADLQVYCSRVASAVGQSVLPILAGGQSRVSLKMRDLGEQLGLGMQLANIVRDVAEDITIDRLYLPQEDLRRYGVTEQMLTGGVMNDQIKQLLCFEIERALRYLRQGERVSDFLPRNARGCIKLLSSIYTAIMKLAISRNYDVFVERLSLSSIQKFSLLVHTWIKR
jgi:15-cis-phytoene synthase